jgi:hypothetical protein
MTFPVILLARLEPTTIQLVTLDNGGRETIRSNAVHVQSGDSSWYRLAMDGGGCGAVVAQFGERRVVGRVDDEGRRLVVAEPIPGEGRVWEWTARLHRARGATVVGPDAVYAWTPEGGWRTHGLNGFTFDSVSLDASGHAVGIVSRAIAGALSECRAIRWTSAGMEPVAVRLRWVDRQAMRVGGCEEVGELDAGGDIWVGSTQSEWFFDSSAAFLVLLRPGGQSRASYRPDFALRAVRRLASGAIGVFGRFGEVRVIGGARPARWLGGQRFWRALRDADGGPLSAWDHRLLVVGADVCDGEDMVVCVEVSEKASARTLAEAVLQSTDAGETWGLVRFRRVDSASSRAVASSWCDVAFGPRVRSETPYRSAMRGA